ncbi:hypothetical protein U1Q18_051237 [Sarracenia purpurea var. burkii]
MLPSSVTVPLCVSCGHPLFDLLAGTDSAKPIVASCGHAYHLHCFREVFAIAPVPPAEAAADYDAEITSAIDIAEVQAQIQHLQQQVHAAHQKLDDAILKLPNIRPNALEIYIRSPKKNCAKRRLASERKPRRTHRATSYRAVRSDGDSERHVADQRSCGGTATNSNCHHRQIGPRVTRVGTDGARPQHITRVSGGGSASDA